MTGLVMAKHAPLSTAERGPYVLGPVRAQLLSHYFPGLKPWAEGYCHFVARIDPKYPLSSRHSGHRAIRVTSRHSGQPLTYDLGLGKETCFHRLVLKIYEPSSAASSGVSAGLGREIPSRKLIATGSTIKVSGVTETRPPTMTTANGRAVSAPTA